jgi:hypothetical protein
MVGRSVGALRMSDWEELALGHYEDGILGLQNRLDWYCLAESRQVEKGGPILVILLRYLRHRFQTLVSLARQVRHVFGA